MSNKQQTAVEWLIREIESKGDAWENASIKKIQISIDASEYAELKAQAKKMEKEQIMKTARQCHFEGVRQSAKTSQEYIDYAEQYYNETFKTKNQ